MGDVDILVPPEAMVAASDRLCEAGWSADGQPPEIVRRDVQRHLAKTFRKGEFGEIDLHCGVFHFSRRLRELDASLWENARPASLAGRPVLVPSPADSVVISIAHGVISGDGDWVMDLGYRVGACQVDWDRVIHVSDRRGLVPPVLSGLTYAKALGVDIPGSVLDHLHEARPTPGEYLKYLAHTLGRKYWVYPLARDNLHSRLTKRVSNALVLKLRKRVDQIANALLPRDRYRRGHAEGA